MAVRLPAHHIYRPENTPTTCEPEGSFCNALADEIVEQANLIKDSYIKIGNIYLEAYYSITSANTYIDLYNFITSPFDQFYKDLISKEKNKGPA